MSKPSFLWKANMIFQMYELYARGETDAIVAGYFDMPLNTFCKRRDRNPLAKAACKYGRKTFKVKKDERNEFDDIVIGHLPEDLRGLWEQLKEERRNPSGVQPTQRMEMCQKQVLWVHAWVKFRFNARKACEFLAIPYRTYQLWRELPRFRKLLDGMMEIKKDFVEDSLMKLIQRQDSRATVFASKTLLRDRGYGEKTEVVGSIEHKHAHSHQLNINLAELDLPLDVQMLVMDAIERKRKVDENGPRPLLLEHKGDGSEVK